MSDFELKTPVAFIIFNRPDTTERVFAEIAKARPPKLLVVGDGPRASRKDEAAKVAATRAIIDRVDWPCEVLTNFSEVNLGCKVRVSSGLDWVFDQVEEAIILEDDCLPHPSFFRFCEELLERYRDDERIGMISGDNFQFGKRHGNSSYYFSRFTHIWGWASWRRAWQHYESDAKDWPQIRNGNWLRVMTSSQTEYKYWEKMFQAVYNKKIDTWDYQWTMTNWLQGMLSITPNVNLISNIGFGVDATHTQGTSIISNMVIENIELPMQHPNIFLANREADDYTVKIIFCPSIKRRILDRLKRIILRRNFTFNRLVVK